MSAWRIRLADVEDCGKIYQVIKNLVENLNQPASSVQITEQELREDKDHYECLLAEERVDSPSENRAVWRVVGSIIYHFGYSIYTGRQVLVVLVYVDPQCRGQGIGRALMKTVAETAAANGCRKVGWTTAHENHKAVSFYHSLGAECSQRHRFLLMNDALEKFNAEDADPRFVRHGDVICLQGTPRKANQIANGNHGDIHRGNGHQHFANGFQDNNGDGDWECFENGDQYHFVNGDQHTKDGRRHDHSRIINGHINSYCVNGDENQLENGGHLIENGDQNGVFNFTIS